MAGREKTIFFAVALLFSLSRNSVKSEINSSSLQQVEDCKNVCRKNFQIRSQLKSCIDSCVIPAPPKNNGEVTEICIKDCLSKNPEGHALCELKCKNILDDKKEQIVATTTMGIVPSDIADEVAVPQHFSDFHARISKMMDCLMDGMRHQLNYGWASIPDLMDSRMDKFIDDTKFLKDSELPPVKVEGIVVTNTDNKDAVNVEKEEAGKSKDEVVPSFGPILHRLIIIKKVPLFSYDENAEVEAADIAATDSMAERLKGFFNNLFGNFEAHDDGFEGRTLGRGENIKSPKVDGEVDKKSNGKFCDFLSNMAHKSGLKRTTFILLMAGILLCFAWYCIATIINIKHHKGLYQEQQSKSIKGDLEYLVPIEEKLIFFAQLDDKEKSNGIVQAPSIPIKIKIQDV